MKDWWLILLVMARLDFGIHGSLALEVLHVEGRGLFYDHLLDIAACFPCG